MTDESESTDERKREAVKRSVHFVMSDEFVRSLDGVTKNMTRDFWSYLDDRKSGVRKKLRDAAWTVWGGGAATHSVPFTHNTKLVVDRASGNLFVRLKETSGKLTELSRVLVTKPVGDDLESLTNHQVFEALWSALITHDAAYPSKERPVTSAVAQVVSERYKAPLPVVLNGIVTCFVPSLLSNGLFEMYRKTMPSEVFSESIVNEALRNGEVERLDFWRFRVVKKKYREWRMRISLITPQVPAVEPVVQPTTQPAQSAEPVEHVETAEPAESAEPIAEVTDEPVVSVIRPTEPVEWSS
jgi:hypothetical protein